MIISPVKLQKKIPSFLHYMARGGNCGGVIACLCVASFWLALVVLMPVLVSLYGSPSSPSFSIDLFDDQVINMTKPGGANNNLTLHFHLKIKNVNSAVGLHYPDPLKIAFSYFPNVSMMVSLADYTVDSFYQGNGKTKDVRDSVESIGVPTALEGTDMIAFRVDLVGTYRYKKVGTKRHKVELGCVVGVKYAASRKLRTGFIGLVQPGLDSKLKPPSTDSYGAY